MAPPEYKVGFSALLEGGKSGIGQYCTSLLQSLSKTNPGMNLDVFLAKDEILNTPFQKVSHAYTKPISSILWHNFSRVFKKYDLLHIPTFRRIPLTKKCPIVATIHDLAPFTLPGKYGALRQLYHEQVLTRAIRNADRIIAVSHATKQDIISFTGYPEEKIDVIYSGIDTNIYRPVTCSQAVIPFFLYVSRLEHPAKNHMRLLQAFKLFKKRTQLPHRLILVGADWQGSDVIRQKAATICDVEVRGFLTNDEVVKLYSTCELMIFPSLYEGFGFPILEAAACGAPVACSNTSSMYEIGEGWATLFDPYDIEAIADVFTNFEWKRPPKIPNWVSTGQQVWDTYARALS